ncbi:MAG: NAD(P)-dependent oxidoreductase [Planctomycetes bacterium]|nr:NAD(P)-dependent oxidoreductase [Planctomycetota bacterium]
MHIGWIGTGVMGRSMAGHLLDAGHTLFIFNRTREKAAALVERGAVWCDSPADVAATCHVVFTMVGYPADLRDVALGSMGLLSTMQPDGLLIDCTTSSPALAVEIAKAAATKGIASLDAPVSGGDVGARNATLSIMVGGEKAAFDRAMPYFEKLGKTIVLQGPAGSGQHTKMVNQILIASGMVAVCEGLIYARACGLDPERVLQSVSGGAAGSWSLTNYAPRMLKGDLAPGFYVEHFLKDMKIALDAADEMKLCLPGLGLAKQLYTMLAAMGGSRNGTQSLIKVLEAMSGMSGPGNLTDSKSAPRG